MDGEAFVDIAVPAEERDRIDHLLDRYDALLAQAEDLSVQIEGLLQEWNPTATPTTTPAIGPTSSPAPEDRSQQ
jgi:hypothetical protein